MGMTCLTFREGSAWCSVCSHPKALAHQGRSPNFPLQARNGPQSFVHLISLTPKLTRSMLPRRPRETLNNFNELVVRSATRIAKLADLMFVREPVQAH